MSIIVCDGCGDYVDTDHNPAAYIEPLGIWECERCQEERPQCGYCGTFDGIRIHQPASLCGLIGPSYICEECFTGTDTGPCFDDLEPFEQAAPK
jgi:hypothetical protein